MTVYHVPPKQNPPAADPLVRAREAANRQLAEELHAEVAERRAAQPPALSRRAQLEEANRRLAEELRAEVEARRRARAIAGGAPLARCHQSAEEVPPSPRVAARDPRGVIAAARRLLGET